MIFSATISNGYCCYDKTLLDISQTDECPDAILKKHGNGFAWDVGFKQGQYNIYLKIKWLPNQKTIKAGNITLTIKYGNSGIKFAPIKNKKSTKDKGDLISFGNINIINTGLMYIVFHSNLNDVMIQELSIEYGKGGAVIYDSKHDAGRVCVTDEIGLFKGNIMGVYRDFSIMQHAPYTNYTIAFNNGYFKVHMDNNPGIIFAISHCYDAESIIIANNSKALTQITDKGYGIMLPMKIKLKSRYKIFVKITHDICYGKQATYYNAFCGQQNKSYWHYMGTICKFGQHTIGQTTASLSNKEHNGHLETRQFKYGNGWSFDNDGKPYPVEKILCYSDNKYKNSVITFDNSTFMVNMKLGGYIHTYTPRDFYNIKCTKRTPPTTPFKFNLAAHIKDADKKIKSK